MNQRTTENMLQQSSFDSKMKEEQERTELFSNQLQIKDRIERMNKEIQNLGESMLEISSLLTDETKNDTGFTFYNDSIKSMTDEEEDDYDKEDDDNDMNVIPFKRFSRDDQSLII